MFAQPILRGNRWWRLCSCSFFCGTSFWCFAVFAVVLTFHRRFLNLPETSSHCCSAASTLEVDAVFLWSPTDTAESWEVILFVLIPCLSLPTLCFLFSRQQSHVDSDPVTPKHVSGELLFSHMLPMFEQLNTPTSLFTGPGLILPYFFLSVSVIYQEHWNLLPSALCYREMS